MVVDRTIPPEMQEGRRRFLELVGELRPELHRYCARMMGSVADGEDVVQDALARAYLELGELQALPALRPWLLRIAHNRALDLLRGGARRAVEPLESALEEPGAVDMEPLGAASRGEAVHLALSRFLEIAPAQRSCVVLKDVLGHSLEEIAAMLELSVPAVKAALHRGRARLRELSAAPPRPAPARSVPPALARYAAMFNARDWEGIRATLLDDVRLDLVSRERRRGRQQVAHYFTNYDRVPGWRLVPAWLDDGAVLAAFHGPADERPAYFIEIGFEGERVASIRDFRYVPYIAREARIELAGTLPG